MTATPHPGPPHPAPPDPPTPDPGAPRPAAGLERRFHAAVVDRAVAWTAVLAVGLVTWRLLVPGAPSAADVLLVLAAACVAGLLVTLALAVPAGRSGVTPGKALLGLRVVDHATGGPVGVRAAALRGLVLGVAGLPTFGLGLATLAWTAAADPAGRRRGWHDRVAGTVVVDVRPATPDAPAAEPGPRPVVNLTALRLAPVPRPVPTATPAASHAAPSPATPATPAPPVTAAAAPAHPPAFPSGPLAPRHAARPPDPAAPPEPTVATRLPAAPGGWRVAFDTGEAFAVEGPVLLGRRPEPRPGEPVRHLVPLASHDMSLSKTHAALQVAPDGTLVVTDRGSTNGSVLVRGGVLRDLPAGRPTTLLDGDQVRFGDRRMSVARVG